MSEQQHQSVKRVTLRDIADEVGMHFTTVLQALKNFPRIRAETLGYKIESFWLREKGLPPHSSVMLTNGEWRDGSSIWQVR